MTGSFYVQTEGQIAMHNEALLGMSGGPWILGDTDMIEAMNEVEVNGIQSGFQPTICSGEEITVSLSPHFTRTLFAQLPQFSYKQKQHY